MTKLTARELEIIDTHFKHCPDLTQKTRFQRSKEKSSAYNPRTRRVYLHRNDKTKMGIQGMCFNHSEAVVGTLTCNHAIKYWDKRRRATPRELAAYQGFPDTYKLPERSAQRLFGNAVSVPVAEWAVRQAVGDKRPATFIDLCAGMGGFHLAVEAAVPDIQCVGYSEIMRAAIRSYETNFPGVPALGDLTQLQDIPQADMVVGGFPCQPFSIALRMKGEHPKAGMFEHVLRVIKQSGASFIVLENVPTLRTRGKAVLERLLAELDTMGFRVQQHLLNSMDFGLKQTRKRLYITGVREYIKSEGTT